MGNRNLYMKTYMRQRRAAARAAALRGEIVPSQAARSTTDSDMKVCLKCGEKKPLDAFGMARNHKKRARCKDCVNAHQRANRKPRIRPKDRWVKDWYAQYGLTLEKYNTMFLAQNGVCAICGKPEQFKHNGKPRNLAIDHNHETGQVRGLLCAKCNIWLGIIENPKFQEFVPLANQYLSKHAE